MMKALQFLSICLFAAATLTGCQLTDRNGSNEITSDMINNPNSGYENVDPDKIPVINFEAESIDFGVITQGERVQKVYKFENTGKTPLVLSSVKAGCGCTIIDNWPRQPILPGEKGEIEIEFNSEGKEGKITKTVSVVANTSPSTTMVQLTGTVLAPNNTQ